MAYVITDACTKDFVCVEECSTAAIAPMAADAAAGTVTGVTHVASFASFKLEMA